MASDAVTPTAMPTVRRSTPQDGAAFLDYVLRNRDRLAPFEPVHDASYYTLEAARGRMAPSEQRIQYVAVLADGRIVGQAALSNLSRDAGVYLNATIGYDVDGEVEGRGVGTHLVATVVRAAFADHGRHRVEAGTLVHNVASQRVLEKCGFTRIGVSPLHVRIAGRWQDHLLFAITRERMEELDG